MFVFTIHSLHPSSLMHLFLLGDAAAGEAFKDKSMENSVVDTIYLWKHLEYELLLLQEYYCKDHCKKWTANQES